MDNEQEPVHSVWNFGNYFRASLFLLFACAILSHDKTDLALLEGGVGGPAIFRNWIGFLGAHAARFMFYLFGLASYPFLLLLSLSLLRRFIPGLPRKGGRWWAFPAFLIGACILFAMWPQQFIAETDHLGIGRMEQSSLAFSGGVIGSSLAAPQVNAFPEAGFIRRYIGEVGTILTALAFLLPALVFLFIRDWLPLVMDAMRRPAASKKSKDSCSDEEDESPITPPSRIYRPGGQPDGEIWNPASASDPEIHHFNDNNDTETDSGASDAEVENSRDSDDGEVAPPFTIKKALHTLLHPVQALTTPDEEPVSPPVTSAKIQRQTPVSAVIRDEDEVVAAPPTKHRAAARNTAVIRDPNELTAAAPPVRNTPQPVPAESAVMDSDDDEVESLPEPPHPVVHAAPPAPPAPRAAPPVPPQRPIPTQTYAENKPGYDRERPVHQEDDEPAPQPYAKAYRLPESMLLDRHDNETPEEDQAYIREASKQLETTLESFGIDGFVSNITVGPRVTQFELSLSPGIRVEKVTSIQNNIALTMSAKSIRIRAPIPGKDTVGIEVPNKVASTVYLRPLLESAMWHESHAAIPILLGRDIAGKVAMMDLSKAPHLLIAGSTGSGKSVCMNTLIMSLLFRFSPDELKLIMVDPKVVELEMYRPIPHLITPVVNDPKKVPLALRWGVNEMERRYMVLAKVKAKNLAAFNSRPPDPKPVYDDDEVQVPQKLPLLLIIIDELADIMMTDAKKDVETSICRIAQKGRAAGVHLVIATQSPRKEVVTGLIKANIPTKIAFRVSNNMDSRVILDAGGAEKLLGNGDMLFNPPGAPNLERIQGAFVSDPEIEKVIEEVSAQRTQAFNDQVISGSGDDDDDDESSDSRGGHSRASARSRGSSHDDFEYDDDDGDMDEIDRMPNAKVIKDAVEKYFEPTDPPIMVKALEIIINEQKISTSLLQRRLGIGYNKAADLIDKLEQRHVVSAPLPGGQKRNILITDGLDAPTDE